MNTTLFHLNENIKILNQQHQSHFIQGSPISTPTGTPIATPTGTPITTIAYNTPMVTPTTLGSDGITTKGCPNDKENDPLPPINYKELSMPDDVVNRYSYLCCKSKIKSLAIKLAREAYFGPSIMEKCTIKGIGSHHALPKKELNNMKLYLKNLCVPKIVSTIIEFEVVWKNCLESVGQSCKALRSKNI